MLVLIFNSLIVNNKLPLASKISPLAVGLNNKTLFCERKYSIPFLYKVN